MADGVEIAPAASATSSTAMSSGSLALSARGARPAARRRLGAEADHLAQGVNAGVGSPAGQHADRWPVTAAMAVSSVSCTVGWSGWNCQPARPCRRRRG